MFDSFSFVLLLFHRTLTPISIIFVICILWFQLWQLSITKQAIDQLIWIERATTKKNQQRQQRREWKSMLYRNSVRFVWFIFVCVFNSVEMFCFSYYYTDKVYCVCNLCILLNHQRRQQIQLWISRKKESKWISIVIIVEYYFRLVTTKVSNRRTKKIEITEKIPAKVSTHRHHSSSSNNNNAKKSMWIN